MCDDPPISLSCSLATRYCMTFFGWNYGFTLPIAAGLIAMLMLLAYRVRFQFPSVGAVSLASATLWLISTASSMVVYSVLNDGVFLTSRHWGADRQRLSGYLVGWTISCAIPFGVSGFVFSAMRSSAVTSRWALLAASFAGSMSLAGLPPFVFAGSIIGCSLLKRTSLLTEISPRQAFATTVRYCLRDGI